MTLRARERGIPKPWISVSLFLILGAPLARAQTITPPFNDAFSDLKGWVSEDVGDAADLGGSDTSVSGGELVLSGSGSRIGGDEDGFRFAYQRSSGDFVAEVKVT